MSIHHKHSAITRYRYCARRAFTLVELVAAMAVTTVLMAGMGSAIMIATNSLPDPSSPLEISRASRMIADQITGDLLCATVVTTMTPNAITFDVADRNHGGPGPETITYAWSGTPGHPLTRQYNVGTIVNFLEDVQEFDLRYDLLTTTVQTPGPSTETPWCYFVNIGIVVPTPETGYVVSDTTWCGMCFSFNPATPVGSATPPPPDPTSFTIDYMTPRMRRAGNGQGSGITALQLRAADANGLPASTVYDEHLFDEGSLDSKSWRGEAWTTVSSPAFSITDVVCLVFKADSGTDTAQILFQDTTGLPEANNTTFVTSSDAGASWTAYHDQAMTQSYIYATFTSGGSGETSTYALTSVGLNLRAGPDPSAAVNSSVQILNRLEVSGP